MIQESSKDKAVVKEENKPLIDDIMAQMNVSGIEALGSAEKMRGELAEVTEKFKIITEFIGQHFVKGVDYGAADPRCDKPTLLKPGAEKIVQLFNTRAVWTRDDDTWEMSGREKGLFCYICRIVSNKTGAIVGEGRGADRVGNKSRDANKAIKAAEKCALVDACLYAFQLSDFFTQEMGTQYSVLVELKQKLMSDVAMHRLGVESPFTDLMFLKSVLETELHKTKATTIEEIEHIRKVLFDLKLYDLRTAKRKEV